MNRLSPDSRPTRRPPVLLLFDIDGTLVWRASAEHAAALREALRQVHGISDLPAVDAAGRTDLEIAREMLLLSGVSAERIDAGADDVRRAACEEYAHRCPDDISHLVLPGIPELLDELAARDGVRLALVTGNLEPIARLKLRRAGIGHRFEPGQGGFGSDSEDRSDLPGIARRRAGTRARPHPQGRTIVIGDTPRDIACARADGVACFAVATGASPAEDLVSADAVAADAAELGRLLAGV